MDSGPEENIEDVVLDSCAPMRPLGVVVLDPSPHDVAELIAAEANEVIQAFALQRTDE